MKYEVSYTQGNGYHCGCCRQTWEAARDFDTLEEAKAFVFKKYVRKAAEIKDDESYEDEHDWSRISIIKYEDVDEKEYLPTKEAVDKAVQVLQEEQKKNETIEARPSDWDKYHKEAK